MSIANALVRLFTWLATATPAIKVALGVASILVAFVTYVNAAWGAMFAQLDNLIAGSLPSYLDFSPLGLINYAFPIDTMLSYLVSYMSIRLVAAGVRILKSFIPTIA